MRMFLTIMTHGNTFQDILPIYPKNIKGWKEEGLGVQVRWKFLGDFNC